MARKEVPQKLIVVESVGTIGELGGISGPVLSPCYVPIDTINTMLNHHRRVYEVNPENYQEKVPLSLKNLRKDNFPKKGTTRVAPRLAPDIHTKAVVRNSNEQRRVKVMNEEPVVMPAPKSAPKAKKAKVVDDSANTVAPVVVEEKKDVKPTSDFIMND